MRTIIITITLLLGVAVAGDWDFWACEKITAFFNMRYSTLEHTLVASGFAHTSEEWLGETFPAFERIMGRYTPVGNLIPLGGESWPDGVIAIAVSPNNPGGTWTVFLSTGDRGRVACLMSVKRAVPLAPLGLRQEGSRL